MSTKSLTQRLALRTSRWLLAAFLVMASILTTTAPAAHAAAPAYQTLVGDVNADGEADLIWNQTSATGNLIFTGLSRGDGSFAITQLQNAGATGWQNYRTLVGDVDGDGRADLIWNETLSSGNHIYVGLSLGNGSFVISPLQNAGTTGWQNYRTLVGDVNGDHMVDLIWNETLSSGNHIYVGLSDGDGSFTIEPLQDVGAGGWQNYRTLVGDVDGDGRADLIWNETTLSSGNHIYTGLSRGDGSFVITPLQIVGTSGWQNYQTLVGDVNQDGKADLIWNETLSSSNRVYTGRSRGDGSFNITSQDVGGSGWQDYHTLVGDVNADGETDLIWNATLSDANRIDVGFSLGNGGFAIAPIQNLGGGDWRNYQTLVGDVNADGRADLIWAETFTSGGCIFTGLSQGNGSFTLTQAECF